MLSTFIRRLALLLAIPVAGLGVLAAFSNSAVEAQTSDVIITTNLESTLEKPRLSKGVDKNQLTVKCRDNVPGSTSPDSLLGTGPTSANKWRAIPFTSLSQGDRLTHQETPPLLIIGSKAEVSRLTQGNHNADVVKQIRAVDFNKNVAVAVFRGLSPSPGYEINVREVRAFPKTMQLIVDLIDPPPAQLRPAVITSPYQVILLPRASLNIAPGNLWNIYTSEGKLFAESR